MPRDIEDREQQLREAGEHSHGDNSDNHESSGTGSVSHRGFAAMSAETQREIASKGGKAAHTKGTAHEFTSEEARQAGRKGGEARQGHKCA